MNWRRLIPNSISSASLIFGVLSIFKTIEGDFFLAPVFIVIAVLFVVSLMSNFVIVRCS